MATAPKAGPKEANFNWEGKNKTGKVMRGSTRAESDTAARAALRRQGARGDREALRDAQGVRRTRQGGDQAVGKANGE